MGTLHSREFSLENFKSICLLIAISKLFSTALKDAPVLKHLAKHEKMYSYDIVNMSGQLSFVII